VASEVEVQRLLVRLIGDNASFQNMLQEAQTQADKAEKAFAKSAVTIEGVKTKIDGVAKSMKDFGNKLQSLGNKMALGLTAPLVAFGAFSVKTFLDFDSAMTETLAKLGRISPELRKQMEDTAKKLSISGEVAYTPTELVKGYEALASAGLSAQQSMAALAPTAKFAQAGAFDMELAVRSLTGALAAYGITAANTAPDKYAQEMIHFSDVISNVAKETSTEVAWAAKSMTSDSAVAAKNYGASIEELAAVLGVYAQANIQAEDAGNMAGRAFRLMTASFMKKQEEWKKLGIDIIDPTTKQFIKFSKAIEKIEKSMTGLTGPQRVMMLDMMGFEALSQKAILPLIGQSKELERQEKIYQKTGVTAEMASIQMESYANQIKKMRNNWLILSEELGKLLVPTLIKMMEYVQEAVEAWKNLDPETRKSIVNWGLVAAAASGVVKVFGGLIWSAGQVISTFAAITPAITGLVRGYVWLHNAINGVPWVASSSAAATASNSYAFTNVAAGRASLGISTAMAAAASTTTTFAMTVATASESAATSSATMANAMVVSMTRIVINVAAAEAAMIRFAGRMASLQGMSMAPQLLGPAMSSLSGPTAVPRLSGPSGGSLAAVAGGHMAVNSVNRMALEADKTVKIIDAVFTNNGINAGAEKMGSVLNSTSTALTVVGGAAAQAGSAVNNLGTRISWTSRIASGFSTVGASMANGIQGIATVASSCKLELGLLAAFAGYQLGTALGNSMFGINEFNKALEKMKENSAESVRNLGNLQSKTLGKLSFIENPEEKRKATEQEIAKLQRDLTLYKSNIKTAETELENLKPIKVPKSKTRRAVEKALSITGIGMTYSALKTFGPNPDAELKKQEIADLKQRAQSTQQFIDQLQGSLNFMKPKGAATAPSQKVEAPDWVKDLLGQNGGKGKKKTEAQKAADRLATSTKTLTDSLKSKIATYGHDNDQMKLNELIMQGLSKMDQVYISALIRKKDALEAAKKAQKNHDDIMANGRWVTEKYLTPQEKYAESVKMLDNLLKSKAISQTTYDRAKKAAEEEMNKIKDKDVQVRIHVQMVDAIKYGSAEFYQKYAEYAAANMLKPKTGTRASTRYANRVASSTNTLFGARRGGASARRGYYTVQRAGGLNKFLKGFKVDQGMPEAVAAKEAPKTETKPVESSINTKLDQLVTIAKGIALLVGLTQKIVDKPTIEFEEADL